ncbi:hypothetical protein ACTXT7_011618 [Hymenolepis weldensis]
MAQHTTGNSNTRADTRSSYTAAFSSPLFLISRLPASNPHRWLISTFFPKQLLAFCARHELHQIVRADS